MTIRIKGLDDFKRKLKMDQLRLERRVTNAIQNLVWDVFTDLAVITPQWSGNMAANWFIVLGSDPTPDAIPYNVGEFWPVTRGMLDNGFFPNQQGDEEAINASMSREYNKIKRIRWNSKIRIVNPVDYADKVEGGDEDTPIRAVNFTGNYGRVALETYINVKYNNPSVLKKY